MPLFLLTAWSISPYLQWHSFPMPNHLRWVNLYLLLPLTERSRVQWALLPKIDMIKFEITIEVHLYIPLPRKYVHLDMTPMILTLYYGATSNLILFCHSISLSACPYIFLLNVFKQRGCPLNSISNVLGLFWRNNGILHNPDNKDPRIDVD